MKRVISGLSWLVPGIVFALAPFGADVKAPLASAIKPQQVKVQSVDCLTTAVASRWEVENPPEGKPQELFRIVEQEGQPALKIQAGDCVPNRTTVRVLLPGDGPANGDVWARNRATHVTFLCRSTKPAALSFHLLQRGKTAGTFKAGFPVRPGEWQRITLPVQQFGLKSFSKIAGLGFRVSEAEQGTDVLIAGIEVRNLPYSDDSWKNRTLTVSLAGDWHFATDPGDQGMKEKWWGASLDDSGWKVLRAGLDWQQQGVDHFGFGWYRQQIVVPKEADGIPMTLTLCPIPSDDDVWVNGEHVGGLSSEYKYNTWITRTYVVPPLLIRYGETNTIALRIWGGDITFIGNKSGLVKGPLVAVFDPYGVQMRDVGGQAVPYERYDLSEARQGKPFEILFAFPAEIAREAGTRLSYHLTDMLGNEIQAGTVPVQPGPRETVQAVVQVGKGSAEAVYLRGRIQATLTLENSRGEPVYAGMRKMELLSFAKRDTTPLPPLPVTQEDTPYGRLTLVDEVDCSRPQADDPHPYIQSKAIHEQDRMPPGAPLDIRILDFQGKRARECGEGGWFAYRVGRGKLKPHSTYLLRIEYPEDKPRFVPIEIQVGQNYMDVGWQNGVAPDDVYDNWPLSKTWQWYDVIVPLDDQTVGTGGTGTAPAENGFWVYFMNKVHRDKYYAMWEGGPAVARMKLYEIDPDKNAPVIRRPEGLPQRVLAFDWERGPDSDPADFCRYAKLMGYSAISPTMMKWFFASYSDPLDGYTTITIDPRDYWVKKNVNPEAGLPATSAYPDRKSQHTRYLEATKQFGLNYIPRFEWGGSALLPKEAWAVDVTGNPAKPNRFAPWCANLLDPRAWDDLKRLMDHLIKPYVQDDPQLTGVLWRIRCDRLPISYGKSDMLLFSKETGTPLPPGGEAQWAAWAAGEMKVKYDDWWHHKRAEFHGKLVELLRSYRPDFELYYYNWDGDKFGLIEPNLTAWDFVKNVVKPLPEGGRAAYEKDRQLRKSFTAADYISVLHTGNFGKASKGVNRADYGLRPELYREIKGIQLFVPANSLCYANLPEYLNYFTTPDGLAVANVVPYDEIGSRSINPKYEGNMITPAGPAFSMALELLAYFHGDARTLNYTVYTYGRGFANAHRRFAQAFLALPAIPPVDVASGNPDVKIRTYPSKNGMYVGVAHKGYTSAAVTVSVPGAWSGRESVIDLVSGKTVKAGVVDGKMVFEIQAQPMELDAFLIK